DGWDVPFKADSECSGVWIGHACYNLFGEPEAILQCIETNALFAVSDDVKAKILVSRQPRTACNDDGIELLYPDVDTHHALINRMKDRDSVPALENGQTDPV